MPPIKGRMMGLAAKPKESDFCSIKSTIQTGGRYQPKRYKSETDDSITVLSHDYVEKVNYSPSKKQKLSPLIKKNEIMTKLRIPMKLCQTLPSLKRSCSKGDSPVKHRQRGWTSKMMDVEQETEAKSNGSSDILSLKRRGGKIPHYHLRKDAERKFNAMIWDVAFIGADSLIMSTTSGVFICDSDTMEEKRQLEEVGLGGGIASLPDGDFAVVDRHMDRVNVYTSEGDYVRSFPAGRAPTNIAVNSSEEIIVTDLADKCVRMFNKDGSPLRVIESTGKGYQFKWPLYVTVVDEDQLVVVDIYQQVIMIFDHEGKYIRNLPLRTICGNEVLRPHGICLSEKNDLFVVDHAIESVEVFTVRGQYLQTLIPSERNGQLQPKVMRVSPDGRQIVIGGQTGLVRVFSFVSAEDACAAELSTKVEAKEEIKEEFYQTTHRYRIDDSPQESNKGKIITKVKIKRERSDVIKRVKSDVIVID